MDTRGELWLNDGRYSAYGQRLQVRRARLLFAGPSISRIWTSKRSARPTT